jgi:hypothetical protein
MHEGPCFYWSEVLPENGLLLRCTMSRIKDTNVLEGIYYIAKTANPVLALHHRFMHLCIIQYPLRTAGYAHINSLNDKQILTQHISFLKLKIPGSAYYQPLRSDIGFPTSHTYPDKVILSLLYTFRTDINNFFWRNLDMLQCISVITYITFTVLVFHLLPPSLTVLSA